MGGGKGVITYKITQKTGKLVELELQQKKMM